MSQCNLLLLYLYADRKTAICKVGQPCYTILFHAVLQPKEKGFSHGQLELKTMELPEFWILFCFCCFKERKELQTQRLGPRSYPQSGNQNTNPITSNSGHHCPFFILTHSALPTTNEEVATLKLILDMRKLSGKEFNLFKVIQPTNYCNQDSN